MPRFASAIARIMGSSGISVYTHEERTIMWRGFNSRTKFSSAWSLREMPAQLISTYELTSVSKRIQCLWLVGLFLDIGLSN